MTDSGSPKTAGGVGDKMSLSPSEAHFFVNIVLNMSNKPDIDWDKVAEQSGFKNAGVAKTRFGQIKRKLGVNSLEKAGKSGTAAGSSSTASAMPTKSPKTPKTPRASKVTKPASAGRGGGRGRGGRVKKEEDNEEADTAMADVPPAVTKDAGSTVKTEPKEEEDEEEHQQSVDDALALQLLADASSGQTNASAPSVYSSFEGV